MGHQSPVDADTSPLWFPRWERAIRWAAKGHAGQLRKSTDVPYIEHPMAVAMILDRAGFTENVVIAGLLHDLVEDTEATIEEVRERFGSEVAEIVADCSEQKTDVAGRKRPWIDRKRDHLMVMKSGPVATRAVILADKLHNLTCIEVDLVDGRDVWSAFNAGRSDVLAYYRASIETCGIGDRRLETLAEHALAVLRRVSEYPQAE